MPSLSASLRKAQRKIYSSTLHRFVHARASRSALLRMAQAAAALTIACLFLQLLAPPVVLPAFSTFRSVQAQDESAQNETHVVAVGETLSQIAQFYHVSQADLMRMNGIQDADAIYVGQELLLPLPTDNAAVAEPDGAAVDSDEAPLLPAASHTVQRGETLRAIADNYGVDIVELMRINFIQDADNIVVGQVLELPGSAVEERQSADGADGSVTSDEEAAVEDETGSADGADEEGSDEAGGSDEVGSEERAGEETPSGDEPASPDETSLDEEGISTPEEFLPEATVEASGGESADEAADEAALEAEQIDRTATLNPTYLVQPGDTPAHVALLTGVSLDALLALNRIGNFDVLSVGQTLVLPATFAELQVIGESQTQQSEAAAEEGLNIHVVAYGETLNGIAQSYDISLVALMTTNLLRNADMIGVGQALRIPDPAEAQAAEEQAAAQENADAPPPPPAALPALSLPHRGFYFYTVQPGDTTAKISLQFDSTPLAIKEFNGLPSEEVVYTGLELQIPYGPPLLPGQRPPTPASGTSFIVSLSRQQCWVMRGDRVLYDWICSTGYGQWTTRQGSFAVQTRIEMAKSYAYSLDMPYWLGIYDVGIYENGIHGLPIRWDTGEKIWEGLIGRPATYGCAMLEDIQAEQLFALSFLGMPVHILD